MSEFEKNMRTSQLVGGGVEVATEVIVNGKIEKLFKSYDLNVPEAVKQFREDFDEYQDSEPEKRHIIIEEIEDELAITILQKGYNIIERTLYEPELAQQILDKIKEAEEQ